MFAIGHRDGRKRSRLIAGLATAGLAVFASSASAAFTPPVDVTAFGFEPQVATDADGDSVIAWRTSDNRVQARTLSSTGTLGTVQTLGATTGTTIESDVRVAIDSQGDAVFVWRRTSGGDSDILFRRLSATGVLGLTGTLQFNSSSSPQVASDVNGDTVAVWINNQDPGSPVEARTISARGVLGPIRRVSPTGFPNSRTPQVDVDQTGDAVITWARDDSGGPSDHVQGRTMTINGSLGPVLDLSAPGSRAAEPQVAVDDDGDATFAWLRFDGIRDRVQTRQMDNTGALQPTQAVSGPRSAQTPQVATDADGDSVFAWESFDSAVDRILARRMTPAGSLFAVQPISAVAGEALAPQLAISGLGASVLTWTRFDGTNDRVQARSMGPAGGLTPVVDLSAAGADAQDPQVDVAATTGAATVVWVRANTVQASQGP